MGNETRFEIISSWSKNTCAVSRSDKALGWGHEINQFRRTFSAAAMVSLSTTAARPTCWPS